MSLPTGNRVQSEDNGLIAGLSPYDPEPERESTRGRLAVLLLLIVAGTLAWILILVTAKRVDTTTLNTLLTGVFTPILTSAGVGTAFYFGSTKSSGK